MSKYSISVENKSGDDQKIAIFQSYPELVDGLPLVWLLQTVNDENTNTFEWEIDWALNWGTSKQTLVPGVKWSSGGAAQKMNPTAKNGFNSMGVTFVNGQFKTSPPAFYDANIRPGKMHVTTDSSFTVAESIKMSIAVYMNGLPAFAMKGRPNGEFMFDTHPTYWICTTDSKEGVAVSGDFLSQAKQISFKSGVTSLSFVLNDTLEFIEVK